MTINRFAARVDATKAEIVATLRRAGWLVYDLKLPVDLLIWKQLSGMYLVECKSLTGKKAPKAKPYTVGQEKFLGEWAGAPIVTATSGADALQKLESVDG